MPVVELTFDSSGALKGAKEFDSASNQVVKSTGKTESALGRMRTGISNLGAMAATAMVGVGVAFSAFAVHAVNAASDMEETQAKFDQVFKGMTEEAEEWAAELNKSFLLSEEQSKRMLGNMQDLLVPMGMASDEAGVLSNEIVKLSADLGSFNNIGTEQVMQDIQSALVGNYETMKKYGVVLKASIVEEKALAMGLAETAGALDAGMKAQAAYQLILEGSSAAVGDVSRNMDTYAAQLRQAQATLADLTVQIGEVFLPIATEMLTAFNAWISNAENIRNVLISVTEAVRFLYNGMKGLELAAKFVIVAYAQLVNAISKLLIAFKPIETLAIKFDLLDESIIDAAQSIATDFKDSAVDGLSTAWKETEVMNQKFDQFKVKVTEATNAFDPLKEKGVSTAGEIKDGVEQMNDALGISKEKVVAMTTELRKVDGVWRNIQVEVKKTAQEETIVKDEAKNYVEEIKKAPAAIDQATSATNKLTTATKAAASAASDYASASGSGSSSGSSSSSSSSSNKSTMVSQMPDYFTPQMMQEYNKYVMDLIGKRDRWGMTLTSQKLSVDKWAALKGYDRPPATTSDGVELGSTGSNATNYASGITVNVSQAMSKEDLANLIADMERAEARQ